MTNKNQTDDEITYREDVIKSVFSQGEKPFNVQSPPNLTIYTMTFVAFLGALVAFLFIIKMPVHVQAVGEIMAGKDYHQIIISEEDKIVNDVLVNESEPVEDGRLLFTLVDRDQSSQQRRIENLNEQIESLKTQITSADEFQRKRIEQVEKQRKEQLDVIKQLEQTRFNEKEILQRYEKSVLDGLVAATLVDQQQRIVTALDAQLIRQASVFTKLEVDALNIKETFRQLENKNNEEIKRLSFESIELKSNQKILSPCDCVVDNIFITNGLPIVAGQSIATLSTHILNSTIVLYIPANEYREIQLGNKIQVNASAYPSNKYGSLKATVQEISASPVPGRLVNKQGLGLDDITYFVVKAVIDDIPPNISLITGMTVNSDIRVDSISLFRLLFDINHKR